MSPVSIRVFLLLLAICVSGPVAAYADGPALDATHCRDGDAVVFDAGTGGLRCDAPVAADNLPCGAAPAPGKICTDGSIYAGISADGDAMMYTTPKDAPGTFFFNDGSEFNFTDTDMENCTSESPGKQVSCRTGAANTALLVAAAKPSEPYAAAAYCDSLVAHGHDDWYLPAADELNVLFLNRALIGGFDTQGGWYWSSSESNSSTARMQRFIVGGQDYGSKDSLDLVRCVRK